MYSIGNLLCNQKGKRKIQKKAASSLLKKDGLGIAENYRGIIITTIDTT